MGSCKKKGFIYQLKFKILRRNFAAKSSQQHSHSHRIRPPDKECVTENYFSYFSTKTYVVGTQKNRLDETVLLSTQNIWSN